MATSAPQTHPLDQAQAQLETRPVLAIDTVLSALGSTRGHRSEIETAEYLDVLAAAVLRASSASVKEDDEDVLERMLDDRKCDRLASAALLRLLVFDDEVFKVDQRLRGSTALFDRTLASGLYPEAQLTPKSQTFLKRDRLRTLVASHEETLIGHVKSLSSLDGIDNFQRVFGGLFSSKPTRSFILPFLPEGVMPRTFDELFSAARAVRESVDTSMLDLAAVADRRCSEMSESAEDLATRYSDALMVGLAETVAGLVRERVKSAGFSDPAKLSLKVRPKRYPLSHPDRPITVRVELSNEGPGQAQDVSVSLEAMTLCHMRRQSYR